MFVKIMDPTGLPDTSPDASFQVIECVRAHICNIPVDIDGDESMVEANFQGEDGSELNMHVKEGSRLQVMTPGECENLTKGKKLIRVVKVDFHGDGGAVMNMYPKGNIYLINDKGKTIASAGPTITVVEPESE